MQTGHSASLGLIVGLILAFTVKHFLADFIAQNRWIALGKDAPAGWFRPLAAHVAVHAALTLLIVLAVAPRLWWLALVDLVVHFGIDRAKCLTSHWGAWTPEDARYWWLFGFDQMLHQFTNVGLAAGLLVL